MGLDPAQLKLNPQLLAFYRSGLRYLFQPGQVGEQSPQERTRASASFREAWLRWLQAHTPPYQVVLTYYQLCFDRGPDPDEQGRQRRDLFARMLSGLQWPDTVYTFWPLSLYGDGDIVADPDLFWQGIQVLRPEYVILFGVRAADTLFPDRRAATEELNRQGVRYVLLPGPDEMLPDNRAVKNHVWHKLKPLPVV